MDDWQETAFTTRHMHNRVNRNGNHNSRNKRNQNFDVRKTFGTYTCTCAAWQKLANSKDGCNPGQDVRLELYRLSPNGEGVVGAIVFPGALNAAVILAASRDSLSRTVEDVSSGDVESKDMSDTAGGSDEKDDDDKDEDEDEDEEEEEPDRFATFEKNSFREPKFWLRWNGILDHRATEQELDSRGSDLGYIVFTQNDCRKFKGTFNCSEFGWKNVPISGRKVAMGTESDVPVVWGPV